MHRQRGQGNIGLWIVALLAVVLIGGAYLYFASDDVNTPPVNGNGNGDATNGNGTGTPPASWETYENEQFGFSVAYPASDWQFASTTDAGGFTPLFNAYMQPPGVPLSDITHHANVTNVSVFPEGIPTEGLIGESTDPDFDPGFAIADNARMYVLEDGTPFAAYMQPADPPASWNESGFVWIRVRMDDLETQCFNEAGEELSETQCEPLTEDHTIQWSGTVDADQWETGLDVLQTMEFDT